MSLKDKIIKQSVKDEEWLKKAKERHENERCLEMSFLIALKILRYLRKHKISQKSLAEQMGCSPQNINKILKGRENLTLETICKLQDILEIELIQISENFEKIDIDSFNYEKQDLLKEEFPPIVKEYRKDKESKLSFSSDDFLKAV